MSRRIVKGTGNHASGYEEDFMVIEREAGFETIGIGDLLPRKLRVSKWCAHYGNDCFEKLSTEEGLRVRKCRYRDEEWICRPPRFRFKITVETEPMEGQ